MFRKPFIIIPVILLLIIGLWGCGNNTGNTNSTSSSQKGTIVIGTQEMPNCEGIAKSLGYFEEAFGELGYEVTILDFSSGAKVNAALLSGDIDFGLIGSCPVSNGLSNGIDYQVIWIHEILGSAESLAVKNSIDIQNISDLSGKTIATPFASTAHYSLLMALNNAGITEKDVTLLDMQPAEIYAAWARGDIDAAYVWEPTLSKLLDDGRIILTSEDMANAGFMTADLEVVRTEFAEKHPDLVEVYLRCVDKSIKLYKNDRSSAINAISNGLEISEDDAEYQMSGFVWLDAQEQFDKYFSNAELSKILHSTAEFLLNQNSIKNLPDQSFFNNAVNGDFIEGVIE